MAKYTYLPTYLTLVFSKKLAMKTILKVLMSTQGRFEQTEVWSKQLVYMWLFLLANGNGIIFMLQGQFQNSRRKL